MLLSSDAEAVGRVVRGMPGAQSLGTPVRVGETTKETAVSLSANSGRWRIVAHLPFSAVSQ